MRLSRFLLVIVAVGFLTLTGCASQVPDPSTLPYCGLPSSGAAGAVRFSGDGTHGSSVKVPSDGKFILIISPDCQNGAKAVTNATPDSLSVSGYFPSRRHPVGIEIILQAASGKLIITDSAGTKRTLTLRGS